DSIGAMTIAGGMMGALFHRERTGEATVVDVSLFGTGLWSMGQALALSLLLDTPWTAPPADAIRANPLVGNYQTKEGRYLSFCCLQAAKYWSPLCDVIGRPELASDPRFDDHGTLMAHSAEAIEILRATFADRTLDEWRERLADFVGQWTVVQDTLECASDPQTVANGYVQECQTAAGVPFRLAAAPVQFDEEPPVPARAPEFNEHGDSILADLGLDWDTIVDLKVSGVVA
ncbi:MAG TPA: CoA transferase, partial [Acidimicrobiales bacterium]|nr:CoA transferase [Acidimicrobiales bacterium]